MSLTVYPEGGHKKNLKKETKLSIQVISQEKTHLINSCVFIIFQGTTETDNCSIFSGKYRCKSIQ